MITPLGTLPQQADCHPQVIDFAEARGPQIMAGFPTTGRFAR
jgi:hypothetical protein